MAEKEEIRREMEGRLAGTGLVIWGCLECWVDFWSVDRSIFMRLS